MRKLTKIITVAAVASISIEVSPIAAENSQKLSGNQIRAKFAGMQLTDEVHFRDVYDRDGTLRNYSMGDEESWQVGRRKGRTLSIFQGTGRWLLRSVALGGPH
jgi:hypothetical protein